MSMFRTIRKHLGVREKPTEIDWQNENSSPLSRYELRETLGTGTFGRVRLVKDKSDGKYYALKISKKSEIIRLKQVEHVKNEVSLLKRIDHPGVVNLVNYFHDDTKLYLVMEYVEGGEMFSHLRNAGQFSNNQSIIYAAEIVLIFEHLHSLNIAYRDLKPENLILTRGGRVKLADFGFAKVVERRTWTLCGTPEYLAPEIIQSKGHGKCVDWWALGVLIYEMLVGYPPFYDENPVQIYQKILNGRFDLPRSLTVEAQDIVQQLLKEDRTKRLGCTKGAAGSVQAHQWFKVVDWNDLRLGKHVAPFLPRISGSGDTSNFERYPESIEDKKTYQLSSAEKAQFDDLDIF